ncbi:MAG: tRNA (N(6)-L-threonylcarbamoyladenosine(37)-C(2))-methylthiotransferase MtaB [Bacilli bacterium]|nr:tRNA (N(6)-L-threonylcarbamoyladenosine(37)-C(2))-methylthiotransferase MtaB [Bacilli bacterium]
MKFNIYTLGCKVNTYETNVMSDLLKNKGYIEVSTCDKADISIINTCTVTNTADNKSFKTIRHAIKQNEEAIIVVVGCMSQNKKEEVLKVDGVDIVLGNIGKSKVVEYIDEYIKTRNKKLDIYDMMDTTFEPMILNNFNKTRAFVKIQDGCNNYCSYCIIPYVRGNVRSKYKEDVIKEVKDLIKEGHKEIVLTGIHTGHYGSDLDNYTFPDLLTDLCKIEGLERLRISSVEITELNDEFLKVLKDNKILVDHMHIPLQSGSNTVLKRMNRKYDKQYFIEKIEKIRNIRPNISITTDVIVGFPNETEEEFNETVETIKKIEFTKLHVFPYSRRKGTKADEMPNQIDEKTKKQRVKILMDLSKELEIKYMNKFIDKEVIFIPEIRKGNYLIGHTGNYLQISLKTIDNLIGNDVKVKIEKIEYPYLVGIKI